MTATIWALVPPIIAIALALITKEVYSSLFIGILAGALLFTGFNPLTSLEVTFDIMADKVGGNITIIIFLVLLGMLVSLMNKSGASKAYGNWATKSIKSKRGALGATSALGALIFVDDYFNCLTVGTVMSPVTDKYKITRAKLAYIIDATAAPVCILAPVSSWAAAVTSSMPEGSTIDGFALFLQTIPANFYALLTILMVVLLIVFNFDFGPMKSYERKHPEGGDVLTPPVEEQGEHKGRVFDLVLPIAALIVFCIAGMLYTGGILEGASIINAFADCSAGTSLALGACFTILFVFLLYIPRKIMTPSAFMESLVDGFKSMVSAILILTFAWTLSGICGEGFLDAGAYVSGLVSSSSIAVGILPAIFFVIALGLAFATGTSWGTFAILIPIAVSVFGGTEITTILTISVASILAGAVCGDHVSPISDTTILASTGANCSHLDHVSTQIPYAMLVAGISCFGFLLAGLMNSILIPLLVSAAALILILFFLKKAGVKNA